MNTAFYIYDDIRLKEISTEEISILNSFEQTLFQARLFRLGNSAVVFILDHTMIGFLHNYIVRAKVASHVK